MAWEALGRGLGGMWRGGTPFFLHRHRTDVPKWCSRAHGSTSDDFSVFLEKKNRHARDSSEITVLGISAFWCEAGGSLAHLGVAKGPPLGTLFSTCFVIVDVFSESFFRSSVLEASGLYFSWIRGAF